MKVEIAAPAALKISLETGKPLPTEIVYCAECGCMPIRRDYVDGQDEYVCQYH